MTENQSLRKAYRLFKDKLTFADFKTNVNALRDDKWNFVRAVSLCQQAMKCARCEPNIAITVLCSSAESIKISGVRGSHQKFKQFYLRHTPASLTVSPIQEVILGNTITYTQASFADSLDYIYSKLRCLEVHEGIGRLELPPMNVFVIGSPLLDKYNGKYYSVERLHLVEWFISITKESLYSYLV